MKLPVQILWNSPATFKGKLNLETCQRQFLDWPQSGPAPPWNPDLDVCFSKILDLDLEGLRFRSARCGSGLKGSAAL